MTSYKLPTVIMSLILMHCDKISALVYDLGA